jgi:hypothetical protein
MNSRKRIYVFSLSKKDIFGYGVDPVNWLRNKDEKPYYFRNKKPKLLPSGSIVLFSFQGRIFGQATVKEDVKELSLKERRQARERDGFEYKYSMILNGSSIDIFPEPYPKKKDVAPKIGKKFGRVFTILDSEQYHKILEMARVN